MPFNLLGRVKAQSRTRSVATVYSIYKVPYCNYLPFAEDIPVMPAQLSGHDQHKEEPLQAPHLMWSHPTDGKASDCSAATAFLKLQPHSPEESPQTRLFH